MRRALRALQSLPHVDPWRLAAAAPFVSKHLAMRVARARLKDRPQNWSKVSKDAQPLVAKLRAGTSQSAGPVPCRSLRLASAVSLVKSNRGSLSQPPQRHPGRLKRKEI